MDEDEAIISLPTSCIHAGTAAQIAADMIAAIHGEFRWAVLGVTNKRPSPKRLEAFARCYVQICDLYEDTADMACETKTYKEIGR